MLQTVLQPYQSTQFTLVGEFIYIDKTPATLRIRTGRGSYELDKGAQIIDAKANGGVVTVELTGSEVGLVRIISGYGQYVPPADGQQVNVATMPALAFDGAQPVGVESMPPVAFDGAQPVSLDALPQVRFDGAQPVAVQTMPSVTVTELPRVKMETGQAIRVYATSALMTTQRANRGFTSQEVTLTADPHHIAENADRSRITLNAGGGNAAAVVIYPSEDDATHQTNGLTLAAGLSFTLDVYGALYLKGEAGDVVTFTEFLR